MKYLVGIIIIILVISGIFVGFNLGKNSNDSSSASLTGSTTSNAVVLDLSNKGLTKVTSDIYDKTATTDLILSNNSIQTLPSQMGRMTNVVIFKIDHNILEGSLIGEIRQMSKLKILDVSHNGMTGMSAEIGQLSNLQSLNYIAITK